MRLDDYVIIERKIFIITLLLFFASGMTTGYLLTCGV